jgi:hypothetical protein
MIGIESFQYLQTSEGLSQISWRGGYDAVDRYEQTINRVRKQHLGLRKLMEKATGQAGHGTAIARHSSLTCGDAVA